MKNLLRPTNALEGEAEQRKANFGWPYSENHVLNLARAWSLRQTRNSRGMVISRKERKKSLPDSFIFPTRYRPYG